MLDLVVLQYFSNIFVNKRSTIIADDLVGNVKPCDDMLSDEIGHGYPGGFTKWNGFNPFCKILRGCQYPNVSAGWRINGTNEVQPPSMERPWCGHILQIGGVCMDQVSLHLVGVACFDEVCRIPLHCWPIIAKR